MNSDADTTYNDYSIQHQYIIWYAMAKYSTDKSYQKIAKEKFKSIANCSSGMMEGIFDVENSYINSIYGKKSISNNWKNPMLLCQDFDKWLVENM